MALDRQSIEKKDFAIGGRGYDPDAVDAHLRTVAEEVEELRRASRRRTDNLASAAAEQVRAIVEAAESSAAEIQREAEEDARAIRDEASQEAERTRFDAAEQARAQVSRVSESTSTMLGRVDAMENELSALIDSLRTGTNRLTADLALLQGNMDEVRDVVPAGGGRSTFGAGDSTSPSGATTSGSASFSPTLVEPEPASPADPSGNGEPTTQFEPQAEPQPPVDLVSAPTVRGGGGDASEGARLIALNMALNGTPRDEADRYLAENFELDDRGGLLDEVYARVGE